MKKILKIAFISTMMPTPTNVNGPSSLPYQLILHRPDDVLIDIYTLNQNKVRAEAVEDYAKKLNCNLRIITTSFFYKVCNTIGIRWLLYRYRKQSFKTLMQIPASIASYINKSYDCVWIYPHFLLGVGRQFRLPIVVTGPDSSALHYERCLHDDYAKESIGLQSLKSSLQREQLLEAGWSSMHNCTLHFVGEEDCRYYLSCNPNGRAFYLRHPSNMPMELMPKHYEQSGGKISIVITGKLNIYTHSDMDVLLHLLCEHALDFVSKYSFTFVGKGWDNAVSALSSKGYEVVQKNWVENYFEELKRHDMQLFPISVGTGTKGKVLDALCAGIVCLGSRYAFENIRLSNGTSAYMYSDAKHIGKTLQNIFQDRERMSEVAAAGYLVVSKDHHPAVIAKDFFTHFNR